MKRLMFILTLLFAGCATVPCEQKPCYQEIGKQDFVNLVQHHAPGPDSIVWYFYAGSDNDYDYFYGYTPGLVYNSGYHYYKMKVGILNLPQRHDFVVSPGPQNPSIIGNGPGNDAQIREQLDKLVGP